MIEDRIDFAARVLRMTMSPVVSAHLPPPFLRTHLGPVALARRRHLLE